MSPEFWAIVAVGAAIYCALAMIERNVVRKLEAIQRELLYLNKEERIREIAGR